MITENGIADKMDRLRPLYLRRHLHTLALCLEEGFDIEGYMYRSLYDSFEWVSGYSVIYFQFLIKKFFRSNLVCTKLIFQTKVRN